MNSPVSGVEGRSEKIDTRGSRMEKPGAVAAQTAWDVMRVSIRPAVTEVWR